MDRADKSAAVSGMENTGFCALFKGGGGGFGRKTSLLGRFGWGGGFCVSVCAEMGVGLTGGFGGGETG